MWTAGYVTEIDYTHGYYVELSPLRMRLAALSKRISHSYGASSAYLELGFGQGLSININVATNPGTYWGNDFNPAHAENAQLLAKTSGADLRVFDNSFEELATRSDLPEFDIIALHGIWSWISDENRKIIVDIARRKLKPGGLFYISYNVTPGWSPTMPLRHLLVEYANSVGSGGITSRIDTAIEHVQRMIDSGASYFKRDPMVVERFKKLTEQGRNYLAHEYFNADWHPMPFSETARILEDAKLSFATSNHLLDHIDAINLSAEAQKYLNGIEDPILKETSRDYFVNQQFRRDLFVKGGRRMSALEQYRALQMIPFALLKQPENVPKKVNGMLGEANLQDEVYGPITEVLGSDNFKPKTLQDLVDSDLCKGLSHQQITQALLLLSGMGAAAPAHDGKTANAVSQRSKALNTELCRRAETSADIAYLAAPLIGSAVEASRFEQLFLRGKQLKRKDIPGYVWDILNTQGQRLLKDGEAVESAEDNIAELRQKYQEFETSRLPIFKRLGIA